MEEAQTIVTEYIQSLDNLPAEVQHYLAEIRDKENKISDIQLRLQARMSSYLRHASRPGATLSQKDAALPEQIALEQTKLTALAEEKLQCAEKIVKLVSRALGRLDVDLARALDRSGEGPTAGITGAAVAGVIPAGPGGASNVMGWMSESITLGSTGAMGLGLGRAGAVTDALRGALGDGLSSTAASSASATSISHPPKRRRMNSTAPTGSPAPGEITAAGRSRLSQAHSRATPPAARSRRATSEMKDADMDVDEGDDPSGDPEDKTLYCTCRNLSYGKMVGCDNDSCPYQWFHLACVGLQDPLPKHWFCPTCVEKHGPALTAAANTTSNPGGGERRRRRK